MSHRPAGPEGVGLRDGPDLTATSVPGQLGAIGWATSTPAAIG